MTHHGGHEPDHTDGEGATIEEATDNVADGTRSDGVIVPPEDARSGEAPVEQVTDDSGTD